MDGAYPRYLDSIQDVQTEEQCGQICNRFQDFNCRSFAYYSTRGECFISGDDRGL